MKSFLVLYCLGFYFVGFGNGIKVEPLSLPNGQYKCYLRCLALCIKKNGAMDKCSEQCYVYQNSTDPLCKQDDTKCWNTCNNLMDASSNFKLQIPVFQSAKYFSIPTPNPRLVSLEWSKVSDAILYVVQYAEFEDEFTTWANGSIGYKETTLLKTILPKENLCSKYSFRVAAVSKDSISPFSDAKNLNDPVPFVSKPAIVVESRELFDVDYIDLLGKKIDNGTVRATIRYNSPTSWRQGDFVPEFTYTHLVACKKCEGGTPSFALPAAIIDHIEPLAYFDLPSFAMRCECTFSASLSRIKSTCGSVFDFDNSGSSNALFNFTCENTKNSNCTITNKIIHPMCVVEDFAFNINPNMPKSKFKQVTLRWKPLQQLANVPVAYWVVHFVNAKKQNLNYPKLSFEEIEDLGVVKVCDHKQKEMKCGLKNGTTEMDVNNVFRNGLFYIVNICAVFNQSTEDTINWNISARGLLDFTKDATNHEAVISIDGQNSFSKLTIGLAIGLTLLLTVIVTGTIMYLIVSRRRSTVQPSLINLNQKFSTNDNHYVVVHR